MDNNTRIWKLKNVMDEELTRLEATHREAVALTEERYNRRLLPYEIGKSLDKAYADYKKALQGADVSIYFSEETETFIVNIDYEGDQK